MFWFSSLLFPFSALLLFLPRAPPELPQSSPRAPPELPQSSPRAPPELPQSSPRAPPDIPHIYPRMTPFGDQKWIIFGPFLVPKLVQKGGTFPKLFPICICDSPLPREFCASRPGDLSKNDVLLSPFYLTSRAPETKMTWLMLKQNSLKLLTTYYYLLLTT